MARARPGPVARILAAILPALLFVPPLSPGRPQVPPWWELRCGLTVRGDYSVTDLDTTFNGEFVYKARWEGTMERDGLDFRLFHDKAEVLAWEIREKTVPADEGVLMTEKETPDKPAFRLNYVIRHEPEIVLNLTVGDLLIPLASSPEKFDLLMPRTRAPGADTAVYDDFVTKGKNDAALDEAELAEKKVDKTFSWDWKRRQWTVRGRGAVKLAETHKVTLVVSLVRHD